MPTYYHDELGMDLMQSGSLAVLPWLSMAVCSNGAGWLADTQMIGKGWSVTTTRKVMQSVGFLGPAACLSLLPHVTSPAQAVGLLMCSQGCDAFSQSGLFSNHQDIGPRYAGVLLGLSNTAGVLAGVIGTAAVGYILENGTWDDVWSIAVSLYLLGTLIWVTQSTGERVLD
jgi:ACS family sodium-dependent inorganic phosphate cotransporter